MASSRACACPRRRAAVIEALYDLVGKQNGLPTFQQLEQLLGEHHGTGLSLIAQAADVQVSWLEGLSDADGYRLMQEWWLVNSGFFIRRVMQRVANRRALEKLAGAASTALSSGQDMAASADIGRLTARQIRLFYAEAPAR